MAVRGEMIEEHMGCSRFLLFLRTGHSLYLKCSTVDKELYRIAILKIHFIDLLVHSSYIKFSTDLLVVLTLEVVTVKDMHLVIQRFGPENSDAACPESRSHVLLWTSV